MKNFALRLFFFVALFFAIFSVPLRAQTNPEDAPLSDQAPALPPAKTPSPVAKLSVKPSATPRPSLPKAKPATSPKAIPAKVAAPKVAPVRTPAPKPLAARPTPAPIKTFTPHSRVSQPAPAKIAPPKPAPVQSSLPKSAPAKVPPKSAAPKSAPVAPVAPAPNVAPEDAPLSDDAPGENPAPVANSSTGTAPNAANPAAPNAALNAPTSAIPNGAPNAPANGSAANVAKSTKPNASGATNSVSNAANAENSTLNDSTSSDTTSPDEASVGDQETTHHTLKDYLNVAQSFRGTDNGFMRQALFSGLLVALFCSYLGLYVVLKRTIFVSVALAEMSSAGVALGLLMGFSPSWGAAIFTLLGVILFSLRISPRRVPHESYIGLIYCVAGALGILLIARSAQGESHMLTLLQGDVLTGTAQETWQMAGAFAVVALIHILFHKEFVLVSFDRDQAATLGFRPAFWEFLLFLTIGVVIAFSVRAVGVLLATALLIVPGMTALLWTHRLKKAWLVAAVLAIIPIPLGLHFSLLSDSLPPSPLIVALSFLILLPSLLYYAVRKT